MSLRDEPHLEARRSRIEVFEERLALSAQSIAHQGLGAGLDTRLDQHFAELTPVEPSEADPETDVGGQLSQHDTSLLPQLANANLQSGVEYVHATYGFEGSGQTVAIIDSGIAYDHLALGGGFGSGNRVVGGYDFAEGDADPYDDAPAGFHGTHVAGIVGSNDTLHTGVAPNVDLVALRVFDDNGAGYFSWVEQALGWVHDNQNEFANPITTVNLSLGTSWNDDTVPDWTTLEDEFAQLKDDGIFVAVSAGNSFEKFDEVGLSYPAASPFVVPVASLDDNGSLSGFSQRHDRVLAAPGRGIVSTVPDFVFGGDGNPNDFGSASGTSMASPYVAGASVLVRQAMEFVGLSNITQDTIYDHLRDTADVFYDTATSANYHSINLQSALDALMPVDDYGSTAAEAYQVGTLSNPITVSGLIGQLDDKDFFTFTASASGTVTVNVIGTHELDPAGGLVGAPSTIVDGQMSFEVAQGQDYTISLESDDGLGSYQLSIEGQAAATTLKSLVRNDGAVYALDSDGWLSINGRRIWSRTQDFELTQDDTLIWHGTSGVLQTLTSGRSWQALDDDAVKFAVREDGTVYSLGDDGWLSIGGRRVWGNTRDFALANDSRLYWHSTTSALHSLPVGGSWQSHGSDVVKFDLREDGALISLDSESWLSVNGRRIWGNTNDFMLSDQSLIWHGGDGALQRLRWGGEWESLGRDVVEFAVRDDGVVYSLSNEASVAVEGLGSWTGIRDLRPDAMNALLLESMAGSTVRVSGRFAFSTAESEVTAVDDYFADVGS